MGDVRPGFPPGLTLDDVRLFVGDQLAFEWEYIKITPKLLTVFGSDKAYAVKGGVYGGGLKGDIVHSPEDRRLKADATLAGLQLQRIPLLKDLTENSVTGALNADLAFSRSDAGRKMSARLNVTNCAVVFATPFLGQKQLGFNVVNAEITADALNVSHIDQCEFKGSQADGSVSGTIAWRRPIEKSVLDLKGAVKAHPSFIAGIGKTLPVGDLLSRSSGRDGIRFRVDGLIDAPGFSLE
jgi:type II secretion system protein N